jgi:hypothetical protein
MYADPLGGAVSASADWLQPYRQASASSETVASIGGLERGVLTAAQLESWRSQGFFVAEDLLDPDLVLSAFAQIAKSGENLALGVSGSRSYCLYCSTPCHTVQQHTQFTHTHCITHTQLLFG